MSQICKVNAIHSQRKQLCTTNTGNKLVHQEFILIALTYKPLQTFK